MIDATILKRLAALQLPSEAFQEVLSIIADLTEADESRRARSRQRTSRWRDNHPKLERDSDVTVTSQAALHPPPLYNTPPKKIDSKKNLSIPDDFVVDLNYATRRGWSIEYATAEAARFRDHALAKGRKCRDWQAAWRNWVTSPYQATAKPNGASPDDPLERRNGESLGALGRRLYAAARDREIAAGIDAAHDTSPIGESGD